MNQLSKNTFLMNQWYLALASSKLKINKMLSVEILNEPVLFFRTPNNQVSAIKDICPHRGIPLKYGRLVNDLIECPYHGWKFDGAGVCQEIPSLTSNQKLDCTKIKVKSFLIKEQFGGIWIFIGDENANQEKIPQPPMLEGFLTSAKPNICQTEIFNCHIDHAVIGLMDPAHGPYVHKSWFWRSEKSTYEKHKDFGPAPYGFKMKRHEPSKNSKAYKILGGKPTTEIIFTIPGTRIEHVKIGNNSFYAVTGLMPINDTQTQIIQMSFWNIPWLSLVKPAIKIFSEKFLAQDIDAVNKQQEGLKYDPNLMLINDADTQAKWYFALKKEWAESLEMNKDFKNPVVDTTLSWRS